MLARQLQHHPARTAAGLAGGLAAARDRLAVMRAENLSVAAAFDLSYQDLTAAQQRLFRRLGLAPGIDAYPAAALDGTSLESARGQLDELYDQHLITEPAPGRYLLHDLLREYARALAAADDTADERPAVGRLVTYYAHVARPPASSSPPGPLPAAGGRPGPPPASAPPVASSQQTAAWLGSERPNLHAAVDYAPLRRCPGTPSRSLCDGRIPARPRALGSGRASIPDGSVGGLRARRSEQRGESLEAGPRMAR
jgi:hypothetical protein